MALLRKTCRIPLIAWLLAAAAHAGMGQAAQALLKQSADQTVIP